ncbi:putative sporulation transcription regulator WhiA [Propionigenium maris DSM 9537]|uniref:Probable cell division protein WhiA n=1 Tax=Propionigenium maris DSM 9537 TaxID=1123000 RepID=A0A9W6LP02_9FUSO|nr:DNA-binding protein WhiA [Propionigenium maris]GLI57901.1 putative sporulation transcription regulator WhiA [Propionigenium maris DSM 9537]
MSYTHQVKEEILKKPVESSEEKMLEVFAFLKSKSSFLEDRIELRLENKDLAERVYGFLRELVSLKIFIKYSTSRRFGEHNVYIITIPRQAGYNAFVGLMDEYEKKDFSDIEAELRGFLRGVFLGCGYIKSPDKEYALDFFIDDESTGEKVYELLKLKEKRVSKTKKRNKHLVYLRNSEDIMDIMVMIGSLQEFFKYEEVIMMKELKNKTIREMNWEVANETKSLDTGKKQIKMIDYISEHTGLQNLSSVLEEVAKLRVKNPEASLTELAEMIGISKSGVRNRFRRIEQIYKELVEKNKSQN